MMLYILDTKVRAMFDNMADANLYYERLKEDEPYARVVPPRRNANEGLYVVALYKRENVEASR